MANCITGKMCPTLYQTDLRITNHKRQKFPPSQISLLFKTWIKWPLGSLQPCTSFLMVFSQLLQYLMQRPSFSAHRAALMTKIDLTFPAFSLKFVDFAVQFCFRCKFLFHEERFWQWCDFPGPITIFCYT